MPPLKAWALNAWRELWIEIPQVWFWLALCVGVTWVIADALGAGTVLRWVIAVPVGVLAYALSWGKPSSW